MIRPGDSRTLNRLASDVSRLDADLVRGRNAYPDDNKPFMAYISGNLAGAHSWYKLVSMDDGDNDQDGWGLEGTVSGSGNVLPAYALDGSTVATGSVVLMWFADVGSEMRFIPPASGGAIDLTGRTGSIADVTALQILRGVISGTAGAAVFTPDDASASLPGIVSVGDQTWTGTKTAVGEFVSSDPGLTTRTLGINAAGLLQIHASHNATDPEILLQFDNTPAAPNVRLMCGSAAPYYSIFHSGTTYAGATGADAIGNTFQGGIVHTISGTLPPPTAIDGGTWT